MTTTDSAREVRHTRLDDTQGQIFGVVMIAFGTSILTSAGLITGQMAGLALLLTHVTGFSFGAVFFAINLPFFYFALRSRGWRFTARTLMAVAGIAALTNLAPQAYGFSHINPWAAALLAGAIIGVGVISLFRHGSSAGGIGILAVHIQDRTGFRAGWFQLCFDAMIFTAGLFILDLMTVLISLFGAIVMNFGIAVNHRRDHYVAV